MVVGVEMREGERERERKRDEGAIAVARSLVGSASREWNSTLCFSFLPFASALSRSPRLLIAESDLERRREEAEKASEGERGKQRGRRESSKKTFSHHLVASTMKAEREERKQHAQLKTSAAAAPMNPKKGATASPAHVATMIELFP